MTNKMIEQEFNRNKEKEEIHQYSFISGMYFGFMLLGLLFTMTLIIFSQLSVPKTNTIVYRGVDGKLAWAQYKSYTENKTDGTVEFEAKDGTIYSQIDDYLILNAK